MRIRAVMNSLSVSITYSNNNRFRAISLLALNRGHISAIASSRQRFWASKLPALPKSRA